MLGEIEDAYVHLLEAKRLCSEKMQDDDYWNVAVAIQDALLHVKIAMKAAPKEGRGLSGICPKCRMQSVERGQCLWNDCGWRWNGEFVRSQYSTDCPYPGI
jgi:hypothetical protein